MTISSNNRHLSSEAKHTVYISIGTTARGKIANLGHISHHGSIESVAFDADRTGSFPMKADPLFDDGSSRVAETFIHCPPPHPDWMAAVRRGEKPGQADFVSPAIPNMLNGEQDRGVGGLPPLGRLAALARKAQNEDALRSALLRLTRKRSDQTPRGMESIRVIILGGWVGGFACGAMNEIGDSLQFVAADLGMEDELSVERYVLLPGTNENNDIQAARANAYAQITEYAARATGHYMKLVNNGDGWHEQSVSAPVTTFLTDKGNAPNVKTRSVSNLLTLTAHALHLRDGPLRSHLERDQLDLQKIERKTGVYGEPRAGRSFGLSVISLNRERVKAYQRERLCSKVLDLHLGDDVDFNGGEIQEAAETQNDDSQDHHVKDAVRSFLQNHALLEGGDYADLTRALIESIEGGIGRFNNLYKVPGTGIESLQAAPKVLPRVRGTLEALWDAELPEAREHKVADTVHAVRVRVERVTRRQGLVAAGKWIEEFIAHADILHERAEESLRERIDEVEAREDELNRLEDDVIEEWAKRSYLKRLINRDELDRVGARYDQEARDLLEAVLDQKAGVEAIEVIAGMREYCLDLQLKINDLLEGAQAVCRRADAEVDRIINYDDILSCPDGIELATKRERGRDIEDIYYDLLLQGSAQSEEADREALEKRWAERILAALRKAHGPLLDGDSADEELYALLGEAIEARFDEALSELHVQQELMRRYPDAETLKDVLAERHQEAYETLRLDRTAEEDAHRLRYLVGDRLKGETLTDFLNASVKDGKQYKFVDTVDTGLHERVYIVQVRQAIGLGHIGDLDTYARAYKQRSSTDDELLHPAPVGRHLPAPNRPVSEQDEQEALLKAHLIDVVGGKSLLKLRKDGSALELQLQNGGRRQIFNGEDKQGAYGAQVEVATQFYNCFRLHGPRKLYDQLGHVERICAGDASPENPVEERLPKSLERDAIKRVRGHLRHYEHNSIEESALWKR